MSMAYVAVAVSVISIGLTAYSQYAAADNAKDIADYNKKAADNNALDAAQRGSIAAAEHRQKVRQMIATQNAAYSSAGVDSSTGTALQVQTDTAGFGELDALRILNNAQRSAAGYKAQGELEQWKGNAAFTNGMFDMAGTALGGASKAYYGGKTTGMWGGSGGSSGTGGGGQ